jgi:hypothetical protein
MELFLMMLARTLLLQAPAVIDWLKELKDEGKTEVTEVDMANLMAKWEISAEDFFKTPPPPPPE